MFFKKKKFVVKLYYFWIEKKCLIVNFVFRMDVNFIKYIKMNEKSWIIYYISSLYNLWFLFYLVKN